MKLLRLAVLTALAIVPLWLSSLEAGGLSAEVPSFQPPQSSAAQFTTESSIGLGFRCIGPTLTSGRIADVTMDPRDSNVWYVAAAAGGLWKTTDAGTTFKCLTDNLSSFCMGAIALDPKNPDVVWLGSGEQQSQRSVDFGDGLYKSTDGGASWKNVGLPNSEHLARIRIDPFNTDVVYVAAQGPLWSPGGDRGVYKTTDGGKTWTRVLFISDNTGVTDLVMDPRNSLVLYAASFQRRRNLGVAVGGGPESGIYKTTDGGITWNKLTSGLPTADMGRIAMALSPHKPDTLYAQIAAAGQQSGFFRTEDAGATWKRVNTQSSGANLYYGEIYCDPHKPDCVYVTDVAIHMTTDGGKTFTNNPFKCSHTDYHCLAFDLKDPKHVLIGQDGGLFETKDGGKVCRHFPNLPVSQFYKCCVDNAKPFYNVFAGAQDNYTQSGPARSLNQVGIRTADWKKPGGGDGFQPRVDPNDPKIFYTLSQNGVLNRNKKGISPGGKGGGGKGMGGGGVRKNWDTAFIISPHSPTRLYYGAHVLFRSDDRGDNWKTVSPDLTRNLDREQVPIMGKTWGQGTVMKHASTTTLSVLNALDESPIKEGLIYTGSDDGMVCVTDNGGESWRKIDTFPGVPALASVSDVCPSHHDVNTVYVSFHNYQAGDFKPYLLKSTDQGKTWTSLAYGLPARDFIWSVLEDPVNKNLLFVGTEFGLYVSVDGGKQWVKMKGGLPVCSFRDLQLQYRESDLVCATFGRGLFVLDDITPLRHVTPEALAKEAVLFPLRKTYVFDEKTTIKPAKDHSDMPNPPFGAVFTYHLREHLAGGTKADIKTVLTVTDQEGKILRHVYGPGAAGFHRAVWDLRPEGGEAAALVAPGTYRVALGKLVEGVLVPLGEAQEFEVVPLLK